MIAKYLIKYIKKNNKVISEATYSKINSLISIEMILGIVFSALGGLFATSIITGESNPLFFILGACFIYYGIVSFVFGNISLFNDLWEREDLRMDKCLTNHDRLKRKDGYIINFKTTDGTFDEDNDVSYLISKNGMIVSENSFDTIVLSKQDGLELFISVSKWLKFIKDQKELPYIEIEEIDVSYQIKSPYVEVPYTFKEPSVMLVVSDEFFAQYERFSKTIDSQKKGFVKSKDSIVRCLSY